MLDRSINHSKVQEAVLEATTKAVVLASAAAPDSHVEDVLWTAVQAALKSNIHFMVIIDGIEQMRNGDASAKRFLSRLQTIFADRNTPSKLIILSRALPADVKFSNAQLLSMDSSKTHDDLMGAVCDMINSDAQYHGLDAANMKSIAKAIVTRAQGSFLWAQLALHFVGQQKTANDMLSSAQDAPESLDGLIDLHLNAMDLDKPETRLILAWLAASERPLQVKEIHQLFTVDAKGPSFISRVAGSESETFEPVSSLVLACDGFVAFRHPMIRDHIRKLAGSMNDDYSNKGEFPFNLKEAHYELLIRSLAWVNFSLKEEVDVSFDKLGVGQRDAFFDSYVLLEYTSRYWYSHLLSSPMITEEGASKFVAPFKRAMPDSVLFTLLELTSYESQFSRSSILELYRVSVDVRGTILGQKSKAYLQSLILSGRASHKADTSTVNEHLYSAWLMSHATLGAASPISISLAELIATTVRAGEWDDTSRSRDETDRRRTDALSHLVSMDADKSPIDFSRRLGYLAVLVKLYKDSNDDESAYAVAKQFYYHSVHRYGSHSIESGKAADFLTHHFEISNTDDMALTLARTKYENMVRTLPVTDDRRIAYTLYISQLYEQQNQSDQAEAVLASLWADLSSRDVGLTSTWDKKTKVAFLYYQFLRRHGRQEEAEVVIRDLSSDLQTEGVRSPEMLERAEVLRNEAREIQLTDMERALSILIWRHYKSEGLEYSPQAVTLAETLVTGMATTNTESLSALTTQDRLLLHQLIDSIASAASSVPLSILILCHNLAAAHIRDEEWLQGSDCAAAVLKHVWPTIESAESDSKFPSEQAPHMANLALDMAYCSFRRLNVPKATVIYGNAFKASIIADKVAIPSVTSVVKTVVEFYETTFQYAMALALLRQVTQFFLSRLGVSDKHTIDSLYHQGDLATRLENDEDAENSYGIIYNASLHDGKINSIGVRAAVALTGLFELNKKWDSALEVYRHLWPTLVRFDEKDGYDRALLEGLLEKTYVGYMKILGTVDTGDSYSERHRVASEYLRLCKKVHGPSHSMTLKATQGLAEVCEEHDRHLDESISHYQQILRVNEWVPSSQSSRALPDMSHVLPITIKHKLAQLYLRKKSKSHEAVSLYKEEMELAKKQNGHSSTSVMLWLREIALFYALQNAWAQGSRTLRSHADEAIQVTDHQETLVELAHRLAEIYLECGYLDAGHNLIDELHEQVVYERPQSLKSLNAYQPAVFVAAFEEVFGKRQSYNQIMDELTKESSVYGSFEQSLSSRDLVPTLASGERLHRVQADQKRTTTAKETHAKLYTYFCNSLSISHLQRKDVIHQFYNICRREVLFDGYNTSIVTATTHEAKVLCDSSRFQDAADLVGAFHSFVHLTDGLQSYESIFTSIKLCLYLNGYHTAKCADDKISSNMQFESKLLLQEIMANAKQINVQLSELPFAELNDLITVLGEHELFEELEVCLLLFLFPFFFFFFVTLNDDTNRLQVILTDLWTSRIVQRTWTINVVVWIGRRLVETRYCSGHVDAAIKLGRDICYNLRQVWGNCDPITLDMTKLLSGMYTASGNYRAATALHESALNELLNDHDAVHNSRASDTVTQHLDLLKHAQARLQKGAKGQVNETQAYSDLSREVSTKFGLEPAASEDIISTDDDVGVWHRPRRFSLDVEEELMHQNNLRNSSGATMLNGSNGGRRISVAAL